MRADLRDTVTEKQESVCVDNVLSQLWIKSRFLRMEKMSCFSRGQEDCHCHSSSTAGIVHMATGTQL